MMKEKDKSIKTTKVSKNGSPKKEQQKVSKSKEKKESNSQEKTNIKERGKKDTVRSEKSVSKSPKVVKKQTDTNVKGKTSPEGSKEKKVIEKDSSGLPVISMDFPKNVNEYRHIIDKYNVTDADVSWVLELRTYKKKLAPISQEKTTPHPPNFNSNLDYDYVIKNNIDVETKRDNSADMDHLYRKRIGEQCNTSNLNFETTLREGHFKNQIKREEWDRILPRSTKGWELNTFQAPRKNICKKALNQIDESVTRPYETTLNKIEYGGRKIVKRSISQSREQTLGLLGDHLSMNKYSWKYRNPNVNDIRHLINDNCQSNSIWKINLREFYTQRKTDYSTNVIKDLQEKLRKVTRDKDAFKKI